MAAKTGLDTLVDEWVKLPGYFGANAGLKALALVAGMLTGADSIDDMAVLRHGALRKLFAGTYAPSTLGSFLRAFAFGHVRQLDAAASRWLANLAAALHVDRLVHVVVPHGLRVARPPIGDKGGSWLDVLGDETLE